MEPKKLIKPLDVVPEQISLSALNTLPLSQNGDLPLDPQSTSRTGSETRRASSVVVVVLAVVALAVFLSSSSGFKDMTGTATRVSRGITDGFGRKPAAVSPGTALLLDNRTTARNITQIALEQQGYKVLIAHSKKQALELVDQNSDAIVLIVVPRRMFDNALMVPGAQVLITN